MNLKFSTGIFNPVQQKKSGGNTGLLNIKRRKLSVLCAEVVVENALRLNSEAVKQAYDRIDHHWRSAHEVLDILRSVVVLQIGLVHHVVNEACHVLHAGCISCRIRTVEGEMEVEVRALLLDPGIVLAVEGLDNACRL